MGLHRCGATSARRWLRGSVVHRVVVQSAVTAACLSGSSPLFGWQTAPAPDFSDAAATWRKSHGVGDVGTDAAALEAVLGKQFAAFDLGLFDIRYPLTALADDKEKRIDQLKEILLGLLDIQGRWLAWIDEKPLPAGKKVATPPPDLLTVRTWIAGWKRDSLMKALAAAGPSPNFATLAGADATILAAAQHFSEGMRNGTLAGLTLEPKTPRLILLPTRAEFVGFGAFMGSLNETWKPLLWTTSLPFRVEFHIDQNISLALEHPGAQPTDPGMNMNERAKTGLLQHVTQYGADRLIRHCFPNAIDPGMQIGLAVDLVIEQYGENNSYVAGSGEGHSTPGKHKFVRGGRSQGGTFAKTDADSHWRHDHGKDWFIAVLRAAQKEGAKMSVEASETKPGPMAHFCLDDKNDTASHDFVTAPFLGPHGASKEVPAEFVSDYQEFLRAYRSGFTHWLATEAKATAVAAKDAAARPFATILVRSSGTTPAKPFDDNVTALYGVALTSTDATSGALEWQFLTWLARQK